MVYRQGYFAAVKDDVVHRYVTTAPVLNELELYKASITNEAPDKKDQGRTLARMRCGCVHMILTGCRTGARAARSPSAPRFCQAHVREHGGQDQPVNFVRTAYCRLL